MYTYVYTYILLLFGEFVLNKSHEIKKMNKLKE